MTKLKTTINSKEMNRIIKDLQKLEKREVNAGFDDSSHSSGLTNKELANILETGVRDKSGGMKTPPRKFLEQAASLWVTDIERESGLVIKSITQGNPALIENHLNAIADKGELSIQESIDMQNFAALKPTTLRLKKDSKHPTEILLETGELYQSTISFIE